MADAFEVMAESCIANREAVVRLGSLEMQAVSQMLLFALAEEIRRREQLTAAANDDEV